MRRYQYTPMRFNHCPAGPPLAYSFAGFTAPGVIEEITALDWVVFDVGPLGHVGWHLSRN